MKLISYMPNENSISEFSQCTEKFGDLNLDGIETIIGDYCPIEVYETLPIKGVHLIYFPTWLEFWQEKVVNCYSFTKKQEMIDCFKKQFELAKKFEVEYMVFHVSHVKSQDIFTMEFEYSDENVFDATLEIINEVFTGDGPTLLFENLPWPGLNFRNYEATKNFFEAVNYKNKGFTFDFSHFMCLNKDISNFDEAADFILQEIPKLKDLKNYIYGIHLNASISKDYLSQDFTPLLEKWENSERKDQYYIESNHIKNIDTHSIFASKKLRDVLKEIPYKYITFELEHKSLKDLLDKVKIQSEYF
ncbi:MAG: TIM barrel protein [Cetobacterium sp.]|uniref:sugar phosphate isomerase/epimerase family protein n=1 Tax=Cetobacterium sp. TaxID=2071632 RepID=UPI002FC69095